MGLFQKGKNSAVRSISAKNTDDIPEYVDTLLENTDHATNDEIDDRFSIDSMSIKNSKSTYGINDAVALMRELPDAASDVIVTVVRKTLESANIDVANIIEDAKQKETQLEEKINQLTAEIESLQAQIAAKKEEINVSSAILSETQKVKELLIKSQTKPTSHTDSNNSKSQVQSNAAGTQASKSRSANEPALASN